MEKMLTVKSGHFFNDNVCVEYELQEEPVYGKYSVLFKQMDRIVNYHRRQSTYKIEIHQVQKKLDLVKERTINEYIDIIKLFYASDLCKYIPSDMPIVSCDIEKTLEGEYTKESLKTTEEGRRYIQRQAEMRKISFEEMLKYIDTHKSNGYK